MAIRTHLPYFVLRVGLFDLREDVSDVQLQPEELGLTIEVGDGCSHFLECAHALQASVVNVCNLITMTHGC